MSSVAGPVGGSPPSGKHYSSAAAGMGTPGMQVWHSPEGMPAMPSFPGWGAGAVNTPVHRGSPKPSAGMPPSGSPLHLMGSLSNVSASSMGLQGGVPWLPCENLNFSAMGSCAPGGVPAPPGDSLN